jgi:hypothetical protein
VSQFPGSNPTIRNTNHHYYPLLLLLLPYLSQPSLAPFSARLGSIRISARIRIGSASKTSARIRIGLGRIRKAKERLGYMKRWISIDFITDLPESEGYRNIIVITDYLSKEVVADRLDDLEAEIVIK